MEPTPLDLFIFVRSRFIGSVSATESDVTGTVVNSLEIHRAIVTLEDKSIADTKIDGSTVWMVDRKPPTCHQSAEQLTVSLKFSGLNYYESPAHLASALQFQEPASYFILHHGHFTADASTNCPDVMAIRDMLRLRRFMRRIADHTSEMTTLFMSPDKLEIPLHCAYQQLALLPELPQLEKDFAEDSVDFDQKLALFKRSLRDFVKSSTKDERFPLIIRSFAQIHESYRKDFLLWSTHAFTELERSFEEKRIKMVTDLNAILGSVQTSVLAAPIGALLIIDKMNLSDDAIAKTIGLLIGEVVLVATAFFLLLNQKRALVEINSTLAAMAADFSRKHPSRREEFAKRFDALQRQSIRVGKLLRWIMIATVLIPSSAMACLAANHYLLSP